MTKKHRRAYGSGSIYPRADRDNDWYGKFWVGGRPRHVRLGKSKGADKLTKLEAEAKLRELRGETKPRASVSEVLNIKELGERYLAHLQRMERK